MCGDNCAGCLCGAKAFTTIVAFLRQAFCCGEKAATPSASQNFQPFAASGCCVGNCVGSVTVDVGNISYQPASSVTTNAGSDTTPEVELEKAPVVASTVEQGVQTTGPRMSAEDFLNASLQRNAGRRRDSR